MIEILKKTLANPYKDFYSYLDSAILNKQQAIDAISISSYSSENSEVNSRYVNLKYLRHEEFIFFTNYNSEKAKEFASNPKISALIYWNKIDVQIRMKAIIDKTSKEFNQMHFERRGNKKNALAISSKQSVEVESYDKVIFNYNKALSSDNLKKCPSYWGGYTFTPYYFEFWEGHKSRINKREVFNKIDGVWKQSFLQP